MNLMTLIRTEQRSANKKQLVSLLTKELDYLLLSYLKLQLFLRYELHDGHGALRIYRIINLELKLFIRDAFLLLKKLKRSLRNSSEELDSESLLEDLIFEFSSFSLDLARADHVLSIKKLLHDLEVYYQENIHYASKLAQRLPEIDEALKRMQNFLELTKKLQELQ
jgi:hypothetical protein